MSRLAALAPELLETIASHLDASSNACWSRAARCFREPAQAAMVTVLDVPLTARRMDSLIACFRARRRLAQRVRTLRAVGQEPSSEASDHADRLVSLLTHVSRLEVSGGNGDFIIGVILRAPAVGKLRSLVAHGGFDETNRRACAAAWLVLSRAQACLRSLELAYLEWPSDASNTMPDFHLPQLQHIGFRISSVAARQLVARAESLRSLSGPSVLAGAVSDTAAANLSHIRAIIGLEREVAELAAELRRFGQLRSVMLGIDRGVDPTDAVGAVPSGVVELDITSYRFLDIAAAVRFACDSLKDGTWLPNLRRLGCFDPAPGDVVLRDELETACRSRGIAFTPLRYVSELEMARQRDVLLVLRSPTSLRASSADLDLVRRAAGLATTALLILLPSPLAHAPFAELQRYISALYQAASVALAQRNDLLLPVEIVIESLRRRGSEVPAFERTGYAHTLEGGDEGGEGDGEPVKRFSTVAMGGTFDHLHAGHRVLLTMAAWVAERRVIAGITDDVLLGKKRNRELLESLQERREAVDDFMTLIAPGLVIDTPALQDVFGPTSSDPDVQGVVVSRESIGGGEAIAKERKRKGLCDVEILVIDLIAPDVDDTADAAERERLKLGSTAIREWLANGRRPREA